MRYKRQIIIILLIIIIQSPLAAQNYFWPTKASTLMSSSFCEFRDGHYHSAIDIKTWLREGYPCYAIADGYIERVRVSPFGYGKVLYLKLNDGNKAVYAHLQRFTVPIDQKIRQMQMTNQKYRIDWYPVNQRVKKGDIIAYTGSTGTGLPHLHFEIRDKRNRPLNPLAYYHQIKDNIRPRLEKIAVIPLSPDTRINGNALPQIFPLTYIKDGIYVIKDPMHVRGKIGLAIKGFDQANGAANKYGFYDTVLEIDGETVFQITYDELNFSQTKHIYTETYYPFWADYQEVFHKLYIEPFNPLNFYKHIPFHDGTQIIKESPKQFSVVVRDFHGNRSIIRGELVPEYRAPIRITNQYYNGNYLFLDFQNLPLKNLQFFYGTNLNNMQQIEYYELSNNVQQNPETILRSKLLIPDTLQKYVKMIVKTPENHTIKKIIRLEEDAEITANIVFLDKRMIVESNSYYAASYLQLDSHDLKLPFYETDNGYAQVVIPAAHLSEPVEHITLMRNEKPAWSSKTFVRLVKPNQKNSFSWFDSTLTLSIPAGAVLDTFLISAAKYTSDSLANILPVASPVYEILPENIPLFRSFSIKLSADSLPAWGRWHIYKTDGDESLSFMAGLIDTSYITLETNGDSFGKFVIVADTIAPYINIITPVSGRQYRNNPEIKFDLNDDLSGIGHEENISILINGEFVLPEWDHEQEIVRAIIDQPLDRGVHTLSVSVSDQAGNISRQAIIFERW
jgi:hypothetical protein